MARILGGVDVKVEDPSIRTAMAAHSRGRILEGRRINGGRIAGEQIKVEQATLFQNRDYPVLTDYRAMFAGLLQHQFG